jgi:hypothetical protein
MENKIDTTPSTVATNALQAIPFGQIIGGPLSACVDAQREAALTTVSFINDIGLTTDKDGNKEAVYVKFQYRRNGKNTVLSIPLLTLIPIPYLAIRDINISFKANISASASTSNSQNSSMKQDYGFSTSAGMNIGIARASASFNANISSKKDSSATRDSKYSVEYTMDVNVSAGQDDMPAGMSKILELLNESVDTVDTKGELNVSNTQLALNGSSSVGTYVTFKNADGYYDAAAIKIVDERDREVRDDVCKITADDPGAVCMFYKEGTYSAVAGEKKMLIVVGK